MEEINKKIVSKKHMTLEIAVVINKQLYDESVISRKTYETVNNSLLKKIKNEMSLKLSSTS